jgi:hypothetical protein
MTRNPNLRQPLKLCRMGHSLYLTIPAVYARAHNLDAHDDVEWDPDNDIVQLRFSTDTGSATPRSAEAAAP